MSATYVNKQAQTVEPASPFKAYDLKVVRKNTLIGFCSVETSSGVIYREVSIHERDGKRWISLPARPWQKADGSTGYVQLIEFRDPATKAKFQNAALRAIEKLLAEGVTQ